MRRAATDLFRRANIFWVMAIAVLIPTAAFGDGNNVNVQCNGAPVTFKLCKIGNICQDPVVQNSAPSGVSASPQDNINFTSIPAGGASITYVVSSPAVTIQKPGNPGNPTFAVQQDPATGTVKDDTNTGSLGTVPYSVAVSCKRHRHRGCTSFARLLHNPGRHRHIFAANYGRPAE